MDLRKVKKLIELVEESGIAELEVKNGDEAIRIARPAPGYAPVAYAPVAAASQAVGSSASTAATAQQNPQQENGGSAADVSAVAVEVRAPMAGTFYTASEPGAEPFVRAGDTVAADAVVCIIESMKMMNEIRAPEGGQLVEVLVTNAEPVATGQLLMRLR